MTKTQRLLANANGVAKKEYGALVNRLLRSRYSLSEELAILRQRDEDPEAFAEYHRYAEECKRTARGEIWEGEA